MRITGIVAALVLAAATSGIAAPLELDASFDGDGRQSFVVPSALPVGPAPGIAVTGDDKIVTVGKHSGPYRFNTNGSFDGTFGTGGVASGGLIDARAMTLQPDGGVLVVHGGDVPDGGGTTHVIDVTRWDASGVVDGTFGTAGIVTINLSPLDAYGEAVLVQPDDKILVAGWVGFPEDLLMVRLEADGTLDPTFGTGGIAITDLGTEEGLLDVLLLPDGRIIGVGVYDKSFFDGTAFPTFLSGADTVAVRFLADGSLDATFGTAGATVVPGGASGAVVATRQTDGKLLLGGGSDLSQTQVLRRLDVDGALDATFGTGGTVSALNGGVAVGLAVQPDDSIVSVGARFTILRYFADGSIDPTVGPCVSLETNFPGFSARAGGLSRMSDGRIVVGGGDNDHMAVARYADGVAAVCAQPFKAKMKYKHFDAGNLVLYKWKTKDPLSSADFGDPTATTDLSLCIIDESTGQPVEQRTLTFFGGETCDGAPCWTQTGAGFKYKRRQLGNTTLDKSIVVLKGGSRGGAIRVKSLRAGNAFPNYVFWGPLTLRLYRSDAPICWDTTFPTLTVGGSVRAKFP